MTKRTKPDRGAQAPVTDEAHAFRAAVRDVKPLVHTPPPQGLVKPKPRLRKAAVIDPPLATRGTARGEHTSRAQEPAELAITAGGGLSYRHPGVRTQVVKRLRRGLIPIEDELDLHGLSQTAARDRLAEFLAYNRAAGRRCVRIIHGKGYRSGARGPVLKIAVDHWLRNHPDVMAFTSARAIDGGTGAVYALLRG